MPNPYLAHHHEKVTPISGIKSLLKFSAIYSLFQDLVGAERSRAIIASTFIRADEGSKILDIGCGPADILHYLPAVHYVGFDESAKYIDAASKRFTERGTFLNQRLNKDAISDRDFDIVLAVGVLHHLNDDEAISLFELSKTVLKEKGRLITIDGCYEDGQSPLARYFLSQDRGEFVRTKSEYQRLATSIFPHVTTTIRHDLLRIPYTHIIMESTML